MRLLRSADLSFEEVQDDCAPPYAILSHTWYKSQDEVTYQQMCVGPDMTKPGYQKIIECARIAKANKYDYFWIDTCCIDKSSSAELSEAINSMYFWYSKAAVCYAYLSDVHQTAELAASLEASRWFTRGWTLQELLAPKDLVFYSADWQVLGNKTDLKDQLHKVTNIRIEALEGTPLGHFSIAERMSWASKRVTTRIEDIAYSLMGIFGINMPLLYGEKEKAFLRLQEQIIQESDDQSILAWKDPSLGINDGVDILARSPKQFEHSSNIRSLGVWGRRDSFAITHSGLRIELWLIPLNDDDCVYLASLACGIGLSYHHSPGIYVKRLDDNFKDTRGLSQKAQFVRVYSSRLEELKTADKINGRLTTAYLYQEPKMPNQHDPIPLDVTVFTLRLDQESFEVCSEQFIGLQVFPRESWNPQTRIFTATRPSGALGAIFVRHLFISTLTIFGVSPSGIPWLNTLPQASFQTHNWSSYEPRGTETTSSQVTIRKSSSRQVVCRSTVSNSFSYGITERKIFAIFMACEAVSLQPPKESASKAEATVTGRSKWLRGVKYDAA